MDATFVEQLAQYKSANQVNFTAKVEAERFADEIYQLLFFSFAADSAAIQQVLNTLRSDLAYILQQHPSHQEQVNTFFDALPQLYEALLQDANAILAADPAAKDVAEVIIAYPGFYATVIYRLSHQLWTQGLRLLPRLLSEYAHGKTGIDIHPGANIGKRFAIDHGTGIVIGETSVVGDDVKIYQGVTLGALNVDKAHAAIKRHPSIEDDVVVYSNATILGGNTVVGKGSIIGGNVWLTQSVPPDSIVYHNSEIRIKGRNPFDEPLNFVI